MDKIQELKENRQHGSPFFHLAIYDNNENYPDSPAHWHDEFELQFGMHGLATVRIEEETYDMEKDQVIIIPSNRIHSVDSYKKPFYFQAIVFDPDMLCYDPIDICRTEYVDPIKEHLIDYGLHITGRTEWENNIIRETGKIIVLYHDKPVGYELGIRGAINAVFFELASNNPKKREFDKRENSERERLKNTIVYIQNNYASKITVAGMAEQCCMSMYYFCRFFKKVMGISPVDYLNRYRIEQAALLLKKTNEPVTEVAYKVGFNDSSYFSKIFQKYLLCTPTEYRKPQGIISI
jgi:AraC-like DNA-binding protein